MNFKKGGPGCPCDCSEGPCEDSCLIPCSEGTPPDDCNFCEIDIQLPAPEITGIDPLLLPPEECPDEAPCWACYVVFDHKLPIRTASMEGQCDDWTLRFLNVAVLPDQSIIVPYIRRGMTTSQLFYCWEPSNYDCPYESNFENISCPASFIAITSMANFATFDDFQGLEIFEFSGNEWDGTCGKLTLKIGYVVLEFSPGYNTDPIGGGGCEDYKWTAYLHTFELNYCTCEEVLDTFTFVSTQSEDSCAGGVEDPCHVDQAVIKINRLDDGVNCGNCDCFNCSGYSNQQVVLEITGPSITGSFVASGTRYLGVGCWFVINPLVNENCEFVQSIFILIRCLACDKFTSELRVLTQQLGGDFQENMRATTDAFDCGDTVEFGDIETLFNFPEGCSLEGHTFQLSFVPS